MSRLTVGIDNGSTGSIGVLAEGFAHFLEVPTQDYLHYGKKGSIGQRLERSAFKTWLTSWRDIAGTDPRIFIERPFSGKFINAVVPAHRFFEATIICLEDLKFGYEVIDSGVWQTPVLGNVKGSPELKRASLLRGIQLYPKLEADLRAHGDADGLLIAHYFHNR